MAGRDRRRPKGHRYRDDEAWYDRARVLVSRGDSDPTLGALYQRLTEHHDAARRTSNESFASLAARAGGALPDDVLGVEQLVHTVIADVAETTPLLLVVLDGMGWPTFTEVAQHLAEAGWMMALDPSQVADHPVYAALPTVTEVSRTSLFAGHVRAGSYESEKRAFADIVRLVAASAPHRPPIIFHKTELRDGGLDTDPQAALRAIGDLEQQVVAVVLNNVDERLKDVTQPPEGWTLHALDPLPALVEEAQAAGRAVITTSDHGHILDRSAQQVTAPGGGERWRPATSPANSGEIEVSGPRVLASGAGNGQSVIVPWEEQRHYGTRRNGYHGGITPQELLVPFAVWWADEPPEDWQPTVLAPPSWWYGRADTAIDSPRPEPTPAHRARPKAPEPADRLFDIDEPTAPVEQAEEPEGELDALVEALEQRRTPQVRLTSADVRALVGALASQGTQTITEMRLAELAQLPPARIGRYLSQLQQLVNVDGYGILTRNGPEIRFGLDTLQRQLGLS